MEILGNSVIVSVLLGDVIFMTFVLSISTGQLESELGSFKEALGVLYTDMHLG